MTRREFTKNLANLLTQMISDGNEPVIDYVLRSTQEQQRLYLDGKSKCDGVSIISKHQKALAVDIYFVVKGTDGVVFVDFGFQATRDLAKKYHDLWVSYGGKEMIEWDPCHYETN